MPELDGFAVVEAVGVKRMPAVIFVTAYDRYAVRAFEVHALDYLLKPFDDERFAKAVERVRKQIDPAGLQDLSRRLQGLLDDLKPARNYVERLVVRTAGRISFVAVADIDWIEAADNYVRLHAGRQSHLLRETDDQSGRETRSESVSARSPIANHKRSKDSSSCNPCFAGITTSCSRTEPASSPARGYRDRVQSLLTGLA